MVFFYSLFGFIGLGIERLVVHPLIKRQIGTEAFGDLGLALSFSTILMMATGGLSTTVFRFHSWRTAEEKQSLFATGFWITMLLGLVLSLGLMFTSFFMADLFEKPRVAQLVFWLAPMVLLGGLASYLSSVMRCNLKIVLSAIMGSLVAVMAIVAVPIIPLIGFIGAPIGKTIGALLAVTVTIIVVKRMGLMKRWFTWSNKEARTFAATAPIFALATISSSITTMLGRWFLAYYGTSESVAYFWVAVGFSMMISIPLSRVSSALVPIICAKKNVEDFSRSTIKIYYLVTLALPVVIFLGGWFIARPMLIIYGRDVLAASGELIVYLLVGQSIYSLMTMNWGFLQKFQPPWVMLVIHISAFVVCLTLNFLLVPTHGARGAAIAASTALAIKGLIAIGLVTRLFFFRPWKGCVVPVQDDVTDMEGT